METISSQGLHLLRIIASYQRKNDACWPSQELLARDMGRSVRTVQRILAELIRWGRIESVYERSKHCCYYRLVEGGAHDTGDVWHTTLVTCAPETTCDELALKLNAAAAIAPMEKKQDHPAQELIGLGCPQNIAENYARVEPELARSVASFCRQRFADLKAKPIANRAGFIAGALRSPEKYGIEKRADGRWEYPEALASSMAAVISERIEAFKERAARERAETARYQRLCDAWQALSEAARAEIEALVKSKLPLFVGNAADRIQLRILCHAELERRMRQ